MVKRTRMTVLSVVWRVPVSFLGWFIQRDLPFLTTIR